MGPVKKCCCQRADFAFDVRASTCPANGSILGVASLLQPMDLPEGLPKPMDDVVERWKAKEREERLATRSNAEAWRDVTDSYGLGRRGYIKMPDFPGIRSVERHQILSLQANQPLPLNYIPTVQPCATTALDR